MNCGIPYCHGTGAVAPGTPGCPVNNQIPDFNDLVYQGNWEEASRNLHSTNNFPEFTGRICPAPCEASCTLNIDDNPVTIKTIECAIVDRAWDNGWIKPEISAQKTGKKVAVIGSGPAGLACAQQLARVGHDVHLFEKYAKAGGLLRYGIPDFKMEKLVIDRRVAQMEAEGVTFHYGSHVGGSAPGAIDPRDMLNHYDVLALTGGAEAPRDLPIPGRDLAWHSLRDGFPATAESPRLLRAARRRRRDSRRRQACGGDRRRRYRIGLHRHFLPARRQVGDPARDHAGAAGAREQGPDLAELAA